MSTMVFILTTNNNLSVMDIDRKFSPVWHLEACIEMIRDKFVRPHKWCSFSCMGESFQDYSWIQDFEADFP